jgi:hypothetical protein
VKSNSLTLILALLVGGGGGGNSGSGVMVADAACHPLTVVGFPPPSGVMKINGKCYFMSNIS